MNITQFFPTGLVILDTEEHTGFKQITGLDSSIKIPVVFLKKREADRLQDILTGSEEEQLTVFMQGKDQTDDDRM